MLTSGFEMIKFFHRKKKTLRNQCELRKLYPSQLSYNFDYAGILPFCRKHSSLPQPHANCVDIIALVLSIFEASCVYYLLPTAVSRLSRERC